MFVGIAVNFLFSGRYGLQFCDKLAFAVYFVGVIVCLGVSCTYHTVHCHSECVGKLFSKYVWHPVLVIWLKFSYRLTSRFTSSSKSLRRIY